MAPVRTPWHGAHDLPSPLATLEWARVTSLVQAVDSAFSDGGVLTRTLDGFRLRPGQQAMAHAVAKVMQDGGVLAVEAGTGVGKTLAYLVPALLSGEKIIISTATKTLQDQLFLRDLPKVVRALGFSVRMALLKGRSSYLCAQRLSTAHLAAYDFSAQDLQLLASARTWAQSTVEGDITELGALQDHSTLAGLVTSTRENCLGASCPHIGNCHTLQARQRAMQAELVVVNHHLFFADAGVRASGVAELLPSVRTVILDEAHQLSDIGVQFLGRRWSTAQARALAQRVAAQNSGPARGMADWPGLAANLARASNALQGLLATVGQEQRRSWMDASPEMLAPADWDAAINHILESLDKALQTSSSMGPAWPEVATLAQRCQDMHDSLSLFAQTRPADQLRWLECGAELSLHQAPLTIAAHMRALLLSADTQSMERATSWIFTSATLGTDAQLTWFVNSCGLEGHTVLQVPSPFNYAEQAALYVPVGTRLGADQDHNAGVAALVARGAKILGGHTMVLTTTLRAMRTIAQSLVTQLAGTGMEVLVQGQYAKRLLVEHFLRSHAARSEGTGQVEGPGCILVATASFWEGVDIAGHALQMVVIDKLPFAPPDAPLVQARALAIAQAGGVPFKALHLPQAALALKQGAGRLIRSESDRGVLVVCDPRLVQKGYGKTLMAGLPPMRRLLDEQQWLETLEGLRKERHADGGAGPMAPPSPTSWT